MQKDKAMAQWCLEEQRRQQQRLATFNHLRPTWKSWVARLLSNLLVVLILQAMYPEVLSEPVLYVLVILIFAQGFDMHNQHKRINKRIDALYSLLSHKD
ncbi:hypothetical protein [Pseudoalteromonas ruthenica]|uniref:hypothetical protein n=1 Tax=Pseudoalteromonas ruthenica TaxID=151081 RepID=UPI00110BE460|nr:hypothetical protein [Pseudoalteromonas ruthenica]TMO46697.1 hypothetical protein CWC24_08930 [Pseudoalteromonas ruthenica]TMO50913.1 hypothetical protein CWC23_09795 [Pseudoalteromonas ruthenica]